MAHKTYNLTPLQICSILMSLSALSCYKTGSVGTSKWPALLFSAAPRGVQTKEGAAVVWQGLSACMPACPWTGPVYLLAVCLVPQLPQWLMGTHAFHWDFCNPPRREVFSSQLACDFGFQKHRLGPQIGKGSIRYVFSSFSCCKLTPHSLFSGALSYLYWGINTRFIGQFHSLFWIPAQVYII